MEAAPAEGAPLLLDMSREFNVPVGNAGLLATA
jgi:hypothetical protein